MNKITIKGEITDTVGVGLYDCYIKITDAKTNLIISYFNTGDKNTFSLDLSSVKADSLIIQVSHLGYENTIVKAKTAPIISISAVMRLKYTHLNEVLIKAPPVWRKGDTTFYNAAYFKEGEERKLKDLIVKIPGFEIKDDGSLYYKNKAVDRIKIDGQELFEDKVKLLLDNFPTHVINTIQAIANESNSRLLKGLDNNGHVTVNLGLEKNKGVVFGSVEGSLSTIAKYNFNPVLFSLKGKIKTSYIGNWNSIGNGIGWQEESELRKSEEHATENWMMQNHPLQTIPDFRNSWYLRNQQWDNRVQVNIPINKQIKSETEINYVRDHQQQSSAYNSSILNGSSYFLRRDSNVVHYKPNLLTVREQLTIAIDSSRELKATVKFFGNFTKSNQQTIYIDTARHYLGNDMADNWRSYSIRLDYTHRRTSKSASNWYIDYNNQQQDQSGKGLSPDWNKIYQLNNPEYNILTQQPDNQYRNIAAGCIHYNPITWLPITLGFNASHTAIDLRNTMQLETGDISKPVIQPVAFSNTGQYSISRFIVDLRKNFHITPNIPLNLSLSFGAATNNIKEYDLVHNNVNAEYAVGITQILAVNKRLISTFDANYAQSQASATQLQGILYPSAINVYKKYANINEPLRRVSFNYGLKWDWPHNLSTSAIGFSMNYYLSGFMSLNNYNSFVSIQTDSLITRPTGTYGINSTNTIPSLLLGALLNIDASYNQSFNYTHSAEQLYRTKISNYQLKVAVRKNWNRKYFIKLSADGTLSRFITDIDKVAGLGSPNIFNMKLSLIQRIPVGAFNIIANTSVFNNNMFTQNKSSFLFADLQVEYKPERQSLSFAVRIDNITNVDSYRSYFNSVLSQSFYSVPLIKRNLSLSVRYEF